MDSKIYEYFDSPFREWLRNLGTQSICEIRLKAGSPIVILRDGMSFLGKNGLSQTFERDEIFTDTALKSTINRLCQSSFYAVAEQIKCGFLTIPGGHRVGFCGRGVLQNGKVHSLTDISYIVIRVSHEVKGAADKVIGKITAGGLSNTIIVSPPGCGKTTLLRDVSRILAGDKYKMRVGIADERGEIAAYSMGKAQNDIGIFSCAYSEIPKGEAILMLIRALSPDVIVTDEIGGDEDLKALESAALSGVKIICSAHGKDKNDICRNDKIIKMIKKVGDFKMIVLKGRGEVREIIDY